MRAFFYNLLWTVTLAFCGLTAHAQEDFSHLPGLLSDEILKENSAIIKKLTAKYPPHKNVYVFVGRSLSAVQLQMDALGYDSLNLPISGKDFFPEAPNSHFEQLNSQILDHVDHHLGHLQDDPRRVILVDYSVSGTGMKTALKLVNHFFKSSKKVISFEVVAYDVFNRIKRVKRFFQTGYFYMLSEDSRLAVYLQHSNFDSLSKFPSLLLMSGTYKGTPKNQNLKARQQAYNWIKSQIGLGSLQCGSFL